MPMGFNEYDPNTPLPGSQLFEQRFETYIYSLEQGNKKAQMVETWRLANKGYEKLNEIIDFLTSSTQVREEKFADFEDDRQGPREGGAGSQKEGKGKGKSGGKDEGKGKHGGKDDGKFARLKSYCLALEAQVTSSLRSSPHSAS